MGDDYQKKFIASRRMTYDQDYLLSCYETQSTYQLKYDTVDFVAGTAVSVIKTWISLGEYECTVEWFLNAFDAVQDTYDGIQVIKAAVKGEAYKYESNRIRSVTVDYYSDDVVYSASSVRRNTIIHNGTSWADSEDKSSYTQESYADEDVMFNTAFTRFVYNYLT